MADDKIKWHLAFAAAVQLELKEYKDDLEFITEYQLTDEPLRIDVLVVKKFREIRIDKSLGRIFKKYNILEYQVILRFRWSFLIRNTYLHMNLRRTYPGA